MYATTKQFLDYFNLESLEQLPPLSEIRDLDEINRGLALEDEKPVGRIIEFPDPGESEQELVVDEEAERAAAIGLRPISEILEAVDKELGIAPAEEDAAEEDAAEEDAAEEDAAESSSAEVADPSTAPDNEVPGADAADTASDDSDGKAG